MKKDEKGNLKNNKNSAASDKREKVSIFCVVWFGNIRDSSKFEDFLGSLGSRENIMIILITVKKRKTILICLLVFFSLSLGF